MTTPFFDRILVLSLTSSIDRRARLPGHLASVGLSDFEFFDACGPDSTVVAEAYEDSRVASFPPCFRCGKTECGDDTCNNTLIPQQIGNFCSCLALWDVIARGNDRVLVLEDDVVLHPWAPRVLEELSRKVAAGEVAFAPDQPRLLRLGWALNRDHQKGDDEVSLSPVLRMSNPCYAITPAFAAKALSLFERFETTSDVFLHQSCPSPGEALSVFPPIASDLSWSTGEVASTIHPKQLHADALRRDGREADARRHEEAIRAHPKHLFWRDLLVLGHPRGGTGFIAETLRRWGLDIGHETDGRNGLSSWMFAVEDDAPWAMAPVARNRRMLRCRHIIQAVRDPLAAIPSIMREDAHAPASLNYRRKHVLAHAGVDLAQIANPVERAVWSLTTWAEIIGAQNPLVTVRI
ncbi:MAG: glycosyltransferase family 25 protein, partial [Pararhodobacter sp.]|nr:glycosyltransferase family 25 protein [Pararhodobacter sp.]